MKPSEQDKQAQQEETQGAEQSEQSEAMNIDAANVAVTETDRLDLHSDYDCGSLDGFYCSTKSVRESDIINEILRQAGQQPEATGTLAAEEVQIMAKSDANRG
ncbi:MAG: hypothetical protein IJ587_06580 [Synergistaceae bacterium]|nr:hypothetical protein [Synergistaceae bacterium]